MKTIVVNSQDLGDVGTIDTYQTFPGDAVCDNLVDFYNEDKGTAYTVDDFEWDFDIDQIVKDFAKLRAKTLEEDADVIQSVKVLGTYSPKEYNYQTDSADFEITYDEQTVYDYIEEHAAEYTDWYRSSGWYRATEYIDDEEYREKNREIARLDYYLNKILDHDTEYYAVAEQEFDIYYNNVTMKLNKETK